MARRRDRRTTGTMAYPRSVMEGPPPYGLTAYAVPVNRRGVQETVRVCTTVAQRMRAETTVLEVRRSARGRHGGPQPKG